MPREEPEARSVPKNNIARLKDTVIPSFLKGKNEQKSSHGKKDIKEGQKVVAFLENNHPVKGRVRYIGDHKDPGGNLICTYVGLELVCNGCTHLFQSTITCMC